MMHAPRAFRYNFFRKILSHGPKLLTALVQRIRRVGETHQRNGWLTAGFHPAYVKVCCPELRLPTGIALLQSPQSVRFTLFENPGPMQGCVLSVGCESREAGQPMDASQSPIWFIGDLGDPWIAAIAESIAAVRSIRRLDCPGSFPDGRSTAPPTAIDRHPPIPSRPRRHRATDGLAWSARREPGPGRVPMRQPVRPLCRARALYPAWSISWFRRRRRRRSYPGTSSA